MREDGEHDRPAASLGGPLDLCVVHERWGGVESTVVLVDGTGRVRGNKTFQRRVPSVGLVDLFGDDLPELVVEIVEGTAMSSWPRVWKIFRVTGHGKLVEVITFAKSYDHGAREPEYYFHNTVTMPAKGTLRVETTVFESRGPAPPARAPRAPAEAYELHYDPARQRFDRRPR
jgi:hypothetical protein